MEYSLLPKRTAFLFFAFGLCWIVLSDALINYLFRNTEAFLYISIIKGILFAAFSAFFIFIILQSHNRQLRAGEKLVTAAEAKFKLMFDNNPIPMWVYDMKTLQFLMVNNAAVATYGYSREQFLSMNLLDIRPKEDYSLLTENIHKDHNDRFTFSGVWRHLKKNGNILYVEINSHPIELNGVAAKLVLSFDVTQRVKTQEEIKLAVNELNNFVYRASHDLRGPLARLIGLSNLVLLDRISIHREEYDHLIHDTAILLDNMLKRLLSVNNLKEYSPESEEINLYSLTEEIIRLTKENNVNQHIAIENLIPPQTIIRSDKNIVELALENIIENSIKYADVTRNKCPYVKIMATSVKNQLIIYVRDNGIGIPQSLKDKIFNLFFRGTELSKGSGLGLYIAQTAVKKLDGEVVFLADNPDETVFEIRIPC
ncbi:PAS domain-containing sensor histidine kinase [Rhodocytophaga aerolata]|uniref:histidine kinase n=1 Tax=Rhodocytophaga aerolata TaxID=455078 RepID=A0ABT8RD75_9BACT|nr:PAS domain-containing sensor histidine kinase [Rhodocytophaga aerolata]MDO1450051.1 PAS domain-containing sensor histidine kinase [Rhodocytophaga aerolata]